MIAIETLARTLAKAAPVNGEVIRRAVRLPHPITVAMTRGRFESGACDHRSRVGRIAARVGSAVHLRPANATEQGISGRPRPAARKVWLHRVARYSGEAASRTEDADVSASRRSRQIARLQGAETH